MSNDQNRNAAPAPGPGAAEVGPKVSHRPIKVFLAGKNAGGDKRSTAAATRT